MDGITPTEHARLAALYEVSSRLGTTLDLPELLNHVMDATIQLTRADRGLLVLFNPLTRELEVKAARNIEREDLSGESQGEISRTVIRRAAETATAILTDNAQEDERFAGEYSVVSYQLRSIMCAPLQARGRVIGAAYVDNRLFSGVFEEPDLSLLNAFAGQAAMAIDNAQLFAQTDQALNRRVQELDLFQRIDQELNKSLNLDRVLRQALDFALTLTAADGGSIGLLVPLEEGGQALKLLAHSGTELAAGGRLVPIAHPVLRQVLETQRSVNMNEVTETHAVDGTPAAAQLAVPIRHGSALIGLLTLESRQAQAFQQEDITFAEQLADRAAVAIENSRLYGEVQSAIDAKSDFVSMVTHELRLPLTAIKGYTDLLAKGVAGPVNEQQDAFLGVVERNLERMRRLIEDLADLNRMESGRMRFEMGTFDLNRAIQESVDGLRAAIARRGQTLTLQLPESAPQVYADRMRTSQALGNLLSNAHKYTPDGGNLRVEVGVREGKAIIDVVDNGLGISEADQQQLFSQFFRAEDSEVREQTGWGLGLSIVKRLVEAQGGEVWFESKLRQGSRFSFSVPLAAADAA